MDITELVKENISKAIKDLYALELGNIMIEHPDNENWGDYSTNVAFELTKTVKQPTREIAKNISYKLNEYEMVFDFNDQKTQIFEEVYSAPSGFINFRLSTKWLQNVLGIIQSDISGYGSSDLDKAVRVALEHSNVNPNKATHIGHLRNACIGQFIERVYEYLGFDVEVQFYVNDVGVQVATSLLGMDKIKEFSLSNYEKFDHYAWDVYAKMESLFSDNAELSEERDKLMVKLEDADSDERSRIKELANKILFEQLKTFQKIDIDYDVLVYESDILNLGLWEKTFNLLKNNDNVYMAEDGPSQGCWLVRLSDNGVKGIVVGDTDIEKDKIIVRSNGVPTYTGKDIAYHMWKFGLLDMDFKYNKADTKTQEKALWATSEQDTGSKITFTDVERVFDVVGGEQTYALDAVKQSLRFLGYMTEADNMYHINYGFVYLSPKTAEDLGIDVAQGKSRYGMSGRKGWGIKIDTFIEMVDNALIRSFGNFSTLPDVRNGAIKFEMLKYNTFQDLVFDLESALSMKGFSGPYLQYTCARAYSVIEKSGIEYKENSSEEYFFDGLNERELGILRWIYRFPEIVQRSAHEFAPNLMCSYLFELAQRFNYFYNEVPILTSNDNKKKSRVFLCKNVRDIMVKGLFLLGITAPERM